MSNRLYINVFKEAVKDTTATNDTKKLTSYYLSETKEDLLEGIFDGTFKTSNWVTANNTPVATKQTAVQAPMPAMKASSNNNVSTNNIVTIVYDNLKQKLRAQANDGVHGKGWVAFPNNLRNTDGQQYEVETLIWNGKNYRVSGNIKPLNSVSYTQNINENFKENCEMNFQTILEELDKLYEEQIEKKSMTAKIAKNDSISEEEVTEEACEKSCKKPLAEAADDDEEVLIDDESVIADEVEEATVEESSEVQLVLECANCGAIHIKVDSEITLDEDSGLADIGEACQYCEEKEGYKIIGTLAPYTVEEASDEETTEEIADEVSPDGDVVEEGLLDLDMPITANVTANGNTVPVLNSVMGA